MVLPRLAQYFKYVPLIMAYVATRKGTPDSVSDTLRQARVLVT